MAKKRVHEIAKERGISSKEVLAVLQKAGLDVKAAASSVDEDDIRRAFSNGAEAAAGEHKQECKAPEDGAKAKPKRHEQQPQGVQQQRPPKQQPESRQQDGGGQRGE